MMFFEAVLAGFLIAIGAAAYLSVGGPLGALIFSVGLVCIISMKFKLFTGQCGDVLLGRPDHSQAKLLDLIVIWCGNLIGATVVGFLMLLSPIGNVLMMGAMPIVTKALAAGSAYVKSL